MKDNSAVVLRPLWYWTTGIVIGVILWRFSATPGEAWLHLGLLILGGAATAAAIRSGFSASFLFLIAGLALGSGRAFWVDRHLADLRNLLSTPDATCRVEAVVTTGWTKSRWGVTTKIDVRSAHHREKYIVLPTRCKLEVRGSIDRLHLPPPGTPLQFLARIRGEVDSPLLVVSSQKLLQVQSSPGGLHHLRQLLVNGLFDAAGTNCNRIRAAEFAAAVSLGRRTELPRDRVQLWRRSGLGHVLAVSGLHVGLVSAVLWLGLIVVGASPRFARLVLLTAVPGYALLAGASPSALRAAAMVVIYLTARLLGRAVEPFGALLLAAAVLLMIDPSLVVDPGFQLTVLITAALMRWILPITHRLPLPRSFSFALVIPLIAQMAAAPIAAYHFRRMIPAAALANLFVPVILTPALVLSIFSVLLAPIAPCVAGLLLTVISWAERLLCAVGNIGRWSETVTMADSRWIVVSLIVAGWFALHPGRFARYGCFAWLLVAAVIPGSRFLTVNSGAEIGLLPVSDGLAVLIHADGKAMLFDAGRSRNDAVEMLTSAGVRKLDLLIISHPDEDHMGGANAVLANLEVNTLVVPRWMLTKAEAVPLLRMARRQHTRIHRVVSGVSIGSSDTFRTDIVWPTIGLSVPGNDRSIAARVNLQNDTILLLADVGSPIERQIQRRSAIQCKILVAAHHGSKSSSSNAFLAATNPDIVLIPAGPMNLHNHPHPSVVARARQVPAAVRYPKRDGWCGARKTEFGWRAFP